jgi:hypothetical protein
VLCFWNRPVKRWNLQLGSELIFPRSESDAAGSGRHAQPAALARARGGGRARHGHRAAAGVRGARVPRRRGGQRALPQEAPRAHHRPVRR